MFKRIILLISIISLSLEIIDNCERHYEICTECENGFYLVRNEWQYFCSEIENCIYHTGPKCDECVLGFEPNADGGCTEFFSLIPNCRNYDQMDKSNCIECMDGYALTSDHHQCIQFKNCRELDADGTHCKICAKHYMLLENKQCIKSTCEMQSKVDYEDKEECISCTEGYYLVGGECHKIPEEYCSNYDGFECEQCYHFAEMKDGKKCEFMKFIAGCSFVDHKKDNICDECSLGYKISNDKTKCELSNCKAKVERCYQCKEDYFIADNGAKCEPMEGTEEETNSSIDPFSRINIMYTLVFLALFL